MRGDNLPYLRSIAAILSVHPHMRGDNGTPRPGNLQPSRFTPTCVGTIAEGCRSSPTRLVHPHMRGDNFLQFADATLKGGSPPHAWGQSRRSSGGRQGRPVHPHMRGDNAGQGTARRTWSVHPHMRGDNRGEGAVVRIVGGSPPHAWGQLLVMSMSSAPDRFTPTCVGTIIHHAHHWGDLAVHPHMRGDNI